MEGYIGKHYFGFDCVCLIKSLLWGWNGNEKLPHGGAVYESRGLYDDLPVAFNFYDDAIFIAKGFVIQTYGDPKT